MQCFQNRGLPAQLGYFESPAAGQQTVGRVA